MRDVVWHAWDASAVADTPTGATDLCTKINT